METLKFEQTTYGNPAACADGAERLTANIFTTLSAMCGAGRFHLSSRDEIESLLENLDIFTHAEYEHMLLFIRRFLERIADAVARSIRHYLNSPASKSTIELFIRSLESELEKVRLSFYAKQPFKSLLALYLHTIAGEQTI